MAYVFDSSAILALLLGEPEASKVAEALERVQAGQEELLLPFMTLMEVRYRLLRDYTSTAAVGSAIVESWNGRVIESNAGWREAAARLKARGGLSLADSWIASLALLSDAELLHKDPEFERVPGLRSKRLA